MTDPDQIEPITVRFPTLGWHQEVQRNWGKIPLIFMNGGIWTAKTSYATMKAVELMEDHPGWLIWWVAGLEWQIDAMWTLFTSLASQLGIRCMSSPHRRAYHPNGARFVGVTAKNLELIAAHHPDFVFGDEWSKWRPQAWHLTRARMIRGGRGFFFTTPRDTPHYVNVLAKCRNHQDKRRVWDKTWLNADERWMLIECSTQEAGIASEAEIEALRKDLPVDLFRQEVMGQIVQGAGSVFQGVRQCATGAPEEPQENTRYVLTYDPAKLSDFGVISVWQGFRQVYAKRWHRTEYRWQAQQVVETAVKYNRATIAMDTTAQQEAIKEMVEEEIHKARAEMEDPEDRTSGLSLLPVVFDELSKAAMVNEAILRFERGEIELIDVKHGDPYDSFVAEHEAYERIKSRGGLKFSYSAPQGLHDDCVSNTLLRMSGARGPRIRWLGAEEKRDPSEDSESSAPDRKKQRIRFI